MITILAMIATALAVYRITGMKDVKFQAFSHVFVGGLMGAFIAGHVWAYLLIVLFLSGVELAAFLKDNPDYLPK